MCGRFDLTLSIGHVAAAYGAEAAVTHLGGPRHNIAPTQETMIVIGNASKTSGDGGRVVLAGRFGLRPDWWTAPTDLINVRTESLAEKPYFAKLAAAQRCVIPATGFFEWRHEGRRKTPFRFVPRAGGLLSMAGLYIKNDFGYRQSYSFAVLTCPASADVAPLHDRMPVLLDEDGIWAWLDAKTPAADLSRWLVPASETYLRVYQVSPLVNNPDNDGPEVTAPLE